MGNYKAKIKISNDYEIVSSGPLFGFNKYAHLNTSHVQTSVLSPCMFFDQDYICVISVRWSKLIKKEMTHFLEHSVMACELQNIMLVFHKGNFHILYQDKKYNSMV